MRWFALFVVVLGCRSGPVAPPSAEAATPASAPVRPPASAGPSARAPVGCTIGGAPCTPNCAVQAAANLAIAPDGSGHCDPAACSAAGGRCAYAGLCFHQACVLTTHDGGRACRDAAECESKICLAPAHVPEGSHAVGACSDVVLNRGCFASVDHGVVQAEMSGD